MLRADVLTTTESKTTRRVSAAALHAFLMDAMRACDLSGADAAIVAGAMLEADLTGSDAHGIFRLPGYVKALKRGAMNPRANIRELERGPATALIDGDLVIFNAGASGTAFDRKSGKIVWSETPRV